MNTNDKDFNVNRNRYYGVRVGDTVKYGIPSDPESYDTYTVTGYFNLDNNRVIVKDVHGNEKPAVAEWCQVITKVEDKKTI